MCSERDELCSWCVRAWQRRVAEVVRGDINYVGGNIYHLWHGSKKNRAYDVRGRILEGFDPSVHIKAADDDSLYEWTRAARRTPLVSQVNKYFNRRKEDGK